MPVIKDGRRIDDPWVAVGRDDDLPDGPVVVPLARWRAERAALAQRDAPLGVRLEGHESPDDIAGDLDCFALVALAFPAFTDGRPYSSARLLRDRYGFGGEIRAVGEVLRDQLQFMARCGFDAFEIAPEANAEAWLRAMSEISVFYQPASDRLPTASALRHRRAESWAY